MLTSKFLEFSTGLERPCTYYLGEGILSDLPEWLERHPHDRVAIVSSRRPFELFGPVLLDAFRRRASDPIVLLIEEGEDHKGWHALSALCESLVEAGVTRRSIILALGGGMVGNVVGMAAGLLYRGVRYVEIPTTLMAQTDGVLSNKQAINGRRGKNQFGLYHAPLFIWSDIACTLHEPARQIRSAVVEGVKNGLVADVQWLERLSDLLRSGLEALRTRWFDFTLQLIRSKLPILERDPSEKLDAVVLEYGHTFGHALEWLSHGQLYHGEAVSIGMCTAAQLSHDLGLTSREVVQLHHHVLGELLGAPTRIPAAFEPQRIHDTMLSDNKRTGPRLQFLLLEQPGQLHNPGGDYLVPVDQADVLRALQNARATT